MVLTFGQFAFIAVIDQFFHSNSLFSKIVCKRLSALFSNFFKLFKLSFGSVYFIFTLHILK